ncbi:MAG: sn-glycerol-3-phosphate ABC transporter ATP-binding protein UgpC [Pseudomonadota bacterium]
MAKVVLDRITKNFGKTEVVRGISAVIEDGAFVVILGPSGCGKSTVLRMIAGLETICSGRIDIGDRRVDDLPPKDRGCAMVFQNYALYPHMTVRGNLAYGLRIAGLSRADRERRIDEAARLLELDGLLDRKPSQLSGGQRQRVAIGRAIVREPDVFLFDEPLSNLDAKLRTAMRTELRQLHDRIGVTSIFVTHDQTEAMTLADRIIVLNGGVIEQIGTPQEIYRHPETRFVAEFIGSPPMNLLDGEVLADPLRFVSRNGLSIGLPERFAGFAGTDSVTLGIRPEDIALNTDGFEIEIDFVEDLGAQRVLYGTAAGERLLISDWTGGVEPMKGAGRASISADRLVLFD